MTTSGFVHAIRRTLRLALCSLCFLPILHAQSSTGIGITLTGDSIVNRRLSVFDEPASAHLFEMIRSTDVSFTNFETTVHSDSDPGAEESGGAYQSSPAWIPSELKWAGFNLFSTANNHAFDFGLAGMRSTLKALDDGGLVHAGTGENLAMARGPSYLDTKHGRVALIACASTLTEGSVAGEQRPDLIGRPGVNPLRFQTIYTVGSSTFEGLQAASKNLLPEDRGPSTAGANPTLRFGGLTFQAGDVAAVHTTPNKADLDGLVASVRNAHRQAEWVIVSSHTHESGAGGQDTPPEFLVTAAHAAIDAGADVFVAHGPHILRGIEIYQGKPIFYSLANFIFENETMQFQPAESYDSMSLPWNATVADYFDARSANDTRGFPVQKAIWESVVAQVSFDHDHRLQSIKLIPISLGYMEPRSERGRPRLASASQSKLTIDTVTRLSAAFGTRIGFSDGVGAVSVSSNGNE
jgi:poly-gamma-glutamate synthesis protein (capsule biosynthesis protein)